MMKKLLATIAIAISILVSSCSTKDNGAKDQLAEARRLYAGKEYALAEQMLDSLHKAYPKALEERKIALVLLDSVRRDHQIQIIATYDSLIEKNVPVLEALKKEFVYQRNKEYQDKGFYTPKTTTSSGQIQSTTLRSGVEENGSLFIESVFVGNSKKHNKLKISLKDGSFAETKTVNDDGLNYRFNTGERQYEVIRFTGADENGVARFISDNAKQPLTLHLEGQAKYSYTLNQQQKTAIAKSLELSTLITQIDSINNEKEKAKIHILYLDNNKSIVIKDKKEDNNNIVE